MQYKLDISPGFADRTFDGGSHKDLLESLEELHELDEREELLLQEFFFIDPNPVTELPGTVDRYFAVDI